MFTSEPFEPKIFERYFQDSNSLQRINHPVCIVGLPDLTRLGMYCAEHLIQWLRAEKFLTYSFNDFEPIVTTQEQHQTVKLTQIEFYLARTHQKPSDFIIITGNGIPTSTIGIHFLADKIAEFITSLTSQYVISIATFPVSYSTPTPRTYFSFTAEDLLQIFKIDKKTNQNKELRLQLLQKGIVMGINGLIVTYAKSLYNTIGGILLAEAVQYVEKDLFAIKAILKVLNTVLNLQLPLSELSTDTKENFEKSNTKSPSNEFLLKTVRKRIKS